jgi:beta-xylosidase
MLRSRNAFTLLCLLGLAIACQLVSQPVLAGPARPAPIGQDPIVPGQVYRGDFPDPSILRIGPRYYAYSTTSYGLNVPMMTSTDLRTWVARSATTDSPTGDALPRTAPWSMSPTQPNPTGPWAPSVTKLGAHKFVLAYAVQVAGAPGTRMCISLARAASPYGPFVDTTTSPTVCPARGAIDPQVFVTPSGRPWLVWKADHFPAKLYTKPMNTAGTRVLSAPSHFVAKVAQPWEGSIIENPAMIRFHKRFYLFYSANSYASTRYAIGYLICTSWKGGCTRPRQKPLLATGGTIAGPGGPTPFLDTRGRLRLGYHAWTVGKVGYPTTAQCREEPGGCGQRRLYLATLALKSGRLGAEGRLRVVQRY